jgi:hypothetical protein
MNPAQVRVAMSMEELVIEKLRGATLPTRDDRLAGQAVPFSKGG